MALQILFLSNKDPMEFIQIHVLLLDVPVTAMGWTDFAFATQDIWVM